MWKILAITMIAVWIVSQAVMAIFCTWAVEKSLEKRDQKKPKELTYYVERETIINYNDPVHGPFTKTDIIGAYTDKEQALAAIRKELELASEAYAGLTGKRPSTFDYPKWDSVEMFAYNINFKEHVWFRVKAF